MSTVTAVSAPGRQKSNSHRVVFTSVAVISMIVAFLGFRLFYMKLQSYPGRPIPSPIYLSVMMHGILMTVWIGLLLVQSGLILTRKLKLHMAIGRIGGIIALLVLLSGLKVAIDATRVNPDQFQLWGMNKYQFMAVPFFTIFQFAIFVGIGLWYRKKPAIHRSMMILATLGALTAAFDRIDHFGHLHEGTFLESIFGPYLWSIVLGLVILIVRSILTRSIDKVFAISLAVLTVYECLIIVVARTSAWESFAKMITTG